MRRQPDDYDDVFVPDHAPPILRVKDAAAVLGDMDPRLLARWCASGFVRAIQPRGFGGLYWVPAPEVARIADELLITPDWDAVM
jgi:hypothetical protein